MGLHATTQYQPDEVFSNYDLGLSSALQCVGFDLLYLDKSNPRKTLFVFRRDGNIEEVANQYFADKLVVGARSYFDALRATKNRLYAD